MDLWTAWLEWLVRSAGHELMLFASVGILLIGLDDLLFDALWLATRGERLADRPAVSRLDGAIAIFLPAWKEAEVLPSTLRRALTAWGGEDFRLYVGCYPNDAATLFALSPLIARDPRLRLVIGESDGPTTKGDNLNRLWTALCEDERAEGRRFAAIVLHDAEDHVHPEELDLYRRHLGAYAMVQIPVVPILGHGGQWVSGHYGDEFAEAHGKELVLRSRLGLPIPSAGVGCALTRNALALLALDRGGEPFRADSLTEDYEIGMLMAHHGLAARFVDATGMAGGRIVSRGSFPHQVDAAVKQKSRWITGIALAGWDHLGWLGRARRDAPAMRIWLMRWMLWRDRRAPLTAIILLAAYAALMLAAFGSASELLLGWPPAADDPAMALLLGLNAMLLFWRLGMRGYFTARCYGWRQGVFAFPRAFMANIIAMLAARRAVMLYCRMLRSGRVEWEKTEHREDDFALESEASPVTAR
ncbi:adsorption protein B [Sphingopyxis panaciterrae]|uniref:glycosyl transferase family protein n=1 Tax=Sphingopyxis panaciterrae TaxID=363841 RepID=UPI0014244B49|nr:glycosyl transferase family protein [Sphingopyxis panaciterrae]NIJ37984.1 adsorption protein B [Sphingopyxis panaciterrae]